MRFDNKLIVAILIPAALTISTGAQSEHNHEWFKVLGDIEVHQGEKMGDIRSVNGSIYLNEDSQIEHATTTNGEISVQDGVTAVALSTVNGSIKIGERVTVESDVKTVNGSIRVKSGGQIGESIKTVNGSIKLTQTKVGRDLKTTNGSIDLKASIIEGDVIFDEIQGYNWGVRTLPKLVIDSASEVKGKIILRQEVELRIAEGATIGEIVRDYPS